MKKKSKTIEYIMGIITGISIMIALWSCTNPLQADGFEPGTILNPLYVKIVE